MGTRWARENRRKKKKKNGRIEGEVPRRVENRGEEGWAELYEEEAETIETARTEARKVREREREARRHEADSRV